MEFVFLLEQVINGLLLGGYYLLIALGLSLIFSLGGVVNLAHGAFYALGAYFAVEITKHLGFAGALVLHPWRWVCWACCLNASCCDASTLPTLFSVCC